MRIETARVLTLEIPFAEPLVTAGGRWERRRVGLVRLVADDATEGIGEVATDEVSGLAEALPPNLAAGLEGLDLADAAQLAQALVAFDRLPLIGRAVRSGVACAIDDVLARSVGSSIAATLTEVPRTDVAVNALIGADEPETAADAARRLVEVGFGCLKIKGGQEPVTALVDRAAAVRDAVGPQTTLRVDLNGSLDEAAAREALEALAPVRLEYVEQPISPALGPEALARLRRDASVAVAADEAVTDLAAARDLLDAGAADVLVVKPARVGGPREAHRICDEASRSGVPVTVSTLFEAGIGIAAALQLAATLPGEHAHGLATADLLAVPVLEDPPRISAGRMEVPTGPGLGVRLDEAAIEALRVL